MPHLEVGRVVFKPLLLLPGVGLLAGFAIGYVDSRPTWDDAGVTAGAVFISAALLAAASPRLGWVTGVAVGIPVLALNAVLRSNYGSAVAVIIALAGAGVGILLGKALGMGAGKRLTSGGGAR